MNEDEVCNEASNAFLMHTTSSRLWLMTSDGVLMLLNAF